jgi:ribosome biogenesis GTPase A
MRFVTCVLASVSFAGKHVLKLMRLNVARNILLLLPNSRRHLRWSTVFARENDEDVELRRNLSMAPWDMSARAQKSTFTYGRPDCMHVAHPVGVLLHNTALQRGAGLLALDEYLESHAGVEEKAFKIWLDGVYGKWQRAQLNHFEHNIQVWMQLWHTIASSSVVCLVADVRNPIWHIPPSLVNEVVDVMKKPLIIVLSKCDLVPDANVRAWTQALRARFPAAAAVIPFSATGLLLGGVKSLAQRRRELKDARGKKSAECLRRVADSVSCLLSAAGCDGASIAMAARRVVVAGGSGEQDEGRDHVVDDDDDEEEEEEEMEEEEEDDLGGQEEDIKAAVAREGDERNSSAAGRTGFHASATPASGAPVYMTKAQQRKARKEKRKAKQKQRVPAAVLQLEEEMAGLALELKGKGVCEVVIGMIGHPNAGKSSIINALCTKKVVSVSRTAGHTKRAQTVHVAPAISVLDCPGLVFPALFTALEKLPPGLSPEIERERGMQELGGVIAIAQIREPYTALRVLGEMLPIEQMYGLQLPRDEGEWSPLLFAETLAMKKGMMLAKTGRPDGHSAGRQVLYDAQDGVLPLAWLPQE